MGILLSIGLVLVLAWILAMAIMGLAYGLNQPHPHLR